MQRKPAVPALWPVLTSENDKTHAPCPLPDPAHRMTPLPNGMGRFLAGIVLRLAVLIALILAAGQLAMIVKDQLNLQVSPENHAAYQRAIMLATAAYVTLTALPFVPGAELGMAMLSMFGASVAPLIYGATVVSLCLSYAVGLIIPPRVCCSMLRKVGAKRAAEVLGETMALPRAERLEYITRDLKSPILLTLTRYRYVGLALMINLPGNVVFGGGGGLAMAAGLCGVFAPLPFLLAVMVAVLPVPLAVLMMGH